MWEKPLEAGEDGAWTRKECFPSLLDCDTTGALIFLPAREVCATAFWIASPDRELALASARLQLEIAGLIPPSAPDTQVDVGVLATTSEKCLLRGAVFPQDYEVPERHDYLGFTASPAGLAPVEDCLLLWREFDRLVIAVSQRGEICIWETLPMPANATDLHSSLELFLLEMQERQLLGEPRKILDYCGVANSPEILGIPVEKGASEGPIPQVPARLPSWMPPRVQIAKENHRKKTLLLKFSRWGLAAVACLALLLGAYLAFLHLRTASLQRQLAALEIETAPTVRVAREWELLSPSIEPGQFALEKLLFAVNALPTDGVRLSVFEALPDAIRIEGDARNVGLATLYFNALQNADEAGKYSWTMPPPALQADNSARFAIDARAISIP